MNQFMKRAVQLAVTNVQQGGSPFGAVLVKDDEIIAEGVNELHKKYDVSSHAELNVIREAQEKLETYDLSAYTMYASGEPCPMCLTSMYYAGIEDIYYCQSLADADEAGLGLSKVIYEDLSKAKEARSIAMKQMPLEKGQQNPMELWVQRDEK